ncbi:hypothetical protein [Clostridium sp. MD294]|uniref:hypothetical protein n=1 Tax=Clostridium sp. MD294 TaxID=97138 RepID=UPI00055182EA|nr:hypothetical protein [Clostridium sp. MD294]NDO45302.1 hypothetical protein [Clostridium sp. MD294]
MDNFSTSSVTVPCHSELSFVNNKLITSKSRLNYKIYGTEVGWQYAYEHLQNNKIDFNSVKEEAMTSITLRADFGDINTQIQQKQQLGYEMDYIVDLMNALEERKD